MKKSVILFLATIVFLNLLKAQLQCGDIVQISVGSETVNAQICCEYPPGSLQQRYNKDREYDSEPVTLLPTYDGVSTSNRFNCHGFVWHMMNWNNSNLETVFNNNDTTVARWIGIAQGNYSATDEVPKYWKSDAYIEVPAGTHPAKIVYSYKTTQQGKPITSIQHSAITTVHPDSVISKNNNGPLMIHHINYIYNSYDKTYYIRKPDINSPSGTVVCQPTTFTLNNPHPMITWEVTAPFSIVSSTCSTAVVVKTGSLPVD